MVLETFAALLTLCLSGLLLVQFGQMWHATRRLERVAQAALVEAALPRATPATMRAAALRAVSANAPQADMPLVEIMVNGQLVLNSHQREFQAGDHVQISVANDCPAIGAGIARRLGLGANDSLLRITRRMRRG